MSLKQAYSLAHSAQCRLNLEAGRPDRNLRFVVGHLMHYESLRLRIVEIEHDISKSHRATAVQFKGTGHVGSTVPNKPSTGDLRRRSPPPKPAILVSDEEDEDEDPENQFLDDEDDEGELGLTRYPSGSAQPPRHAIPELELDGLSDSDSDEDEPISPEEPDQATLEAAMKSAGDETYAKIYNGVRRCPCHGKGDSPTIERMWELPGGEKDGKTRMIAQVSEVAAVT